MLKVKFASSTNVSGQSPVHQLFLADNPTAGLNQNQKGIEDLGRQREGLAFTQQNSLIGIKGELPEPIGMVDKQRHYRP
jgi:hypothetical protein